MTYFTNEIGSLSGLLSARERELASYRRRVDTIQNQLALIGLWRRWLQSSSSSSVVSSPVTASGPTSSSAATGGPTTVFSSSSAEAVTLASFKMQLCRRPDLCGALTSDATGQTSGSVGASVSPLPHPTLAADQVTCAFSTFSSLYHFFTFYL
ncbi:unnamed protein product [Protopolystoma xenopodis]|uniref:Uncharacterized protein n=1 Tax=Protopolystoma xenopodis TaxID=117903 RepID=A0A3S5BTI1_9PLAT|nr:unnamed protein product [Protopolystoma xenopodis]